MPEQYRHYDAPSRPQAVTVRWEMVTEMETDCHDAPDERQDGFWPSLDPSDAGWIGENPERDYDTQLADATARMKAWREGDWHYVGIIARAHISLPMGQGSFVTYTLESPGLWGIESDAGDYLAEVYAEQQAELLENLKQLGEWAAAEIAARTAPAVSAH